VTVSEIKQIVERFRSGDEESAFFTLIELPGDVLPALIEIFREEQVPQIRAFLVKAAWERRDEAVIPFLSEVLHGAEEEAWQQALDGLVAFASPQSMAILRAARSREFAEESATKRFHLWVEEAIEQVEFELHAKK
jgi:hypothetical protein